MGQGATQGEKEVAGGEMVISVVFLYNLRDFVTA